MIVFDLRCSHGHVFEAWFRSSADYESQRERALVRCPVCDDAGITKAVMTPNVAPKGNQRDARLPAVPDAPATPSATLPSLPAEGPPPPEVIRQVLAHVAQVQARALAQSQWVGTAFAERARAMHAGDEPAAVIHGQATRDEVEALVDEGVPVTPLLVPVVPPEARN